MSSNVTFIAHLRAAGSGAFAAPTVHKAHAAVGNQTSQQPSGRGADRLRASPHPLWPCEANQRRSAARREALDRAALLVDTPAVPPREQPGAPISGHCEASVSAYVQRWPSRVAPMTRRSARSASTRSVSRRACR